MQLVGKQNLSNVYGERLKDDQLTDDKSPCLSKCCAENAERQNISSAPFVCQQTIGNNKQGYRSVRTPMDLRATLRQKRDLLGASSINRSTPLIRASASCTGFTLQSRNSSLYSWPSVLA